MLFKSFRIALSSFPLTCVLSHLAGYLQVITDSKSHVCKEILKTQENLSKIQVCRDTTLCPSLSIYRHFEGSWHFLLDGKVVLFYCMTLQLKELTDCVGSNPRTTQLRESWTSKNFRRQGITQKKAYNNQKSSFFQMRYFVKNFCF